MAKGGHRYGAGRPASKGKAEHCLSIDVRRWHRHGVLQPGRAGGWHWTNTQTGERVGSISYRMIDGAVILDYSISGTPRPQTVRLTSTPCTYGGARPWFVCPVRGERVAVLYMRAGRFACRHCQRIAYQSQSEDALGRTWLRQQKAEAKLREDLQRPKGMHHATRERLLSIIWDCEERRDVGLMQYLARFAARHPDLREDLARFG